MSAREAEIIDAFGNRRSAAMPTSYAFVYHVTDPTALSLTPDTGWKAQNGLAASRFANLVVAAGLPLNAQDPTGQHAHAAFAELKSYFPALSLEVLSTGAEVHSGTVEGLPRLLRPGNASRNRESAPVRMVPATFTAKTQQPRLLDVASLVDCQTGGVIVTHP